MLCGGRGTKWRPVPQSRAGQSHLPALPVSSCSTGLMGQSMERAHEWLGQKVLASWAVGTQPPNLTRGRPSPLLAGTAWDQLTSTAAGSGSPAGCLDLAMSSQLPGAHPGGTRPLAALSEPPFSLSTPAFSFHSLHLWSTSLHEFSAFHLLCNFGPSLSLSEPRSPSSVTWGIPSTSPRWCGYRATPAWCSGGQAAHEGVSLSFGFLLGKMGTK